MSAQSGAASTRPYLLRAIYQWALDNALTPQVLVDATWQGVRVPQGSAADGRIVLTIHPNAVRDLEMGDEYLSFSTRFGGRPHQVVLPISAVLAIYSRENGRGLFFHAEQDAPGAQSPPAPGKPAQSPPKLSPLEKPSPAAKSTQPPSPSTPSPDKPPPKKPGAPHLKLVK